VDIRWCQSVPGAMCKTPHAPTLRHLSFGVGLMLADPVVCAQRSQRR
jgi:hypothetical protein